MSSKGSHACASSDVNHFALGGFDVEVSKWADAGNDVAWFQAEYIAGSCAGRTVLTRRGRGDAHVKAQCPLRLLVASKGIIVASPGNGILGDKIEDMLILPYSGKRLRDVEVSKVDRIVDGNIELQVVAGNEND